MSIQTTSFLKMKGDLDESGHKLNRWEPAPIDSGETAESYFPYARLGYPIK